MSIFVVRYKKARWIPEQKPTWSGSLTADNLNFKDDQEGP